MVSHLDESPAGQREEKRNTSAAAGVLATATALGAASAMADIVTVTTTQQSGTAVPSSGSTASFDVLFTPIQDVTDLVSISAGSVYTGEGASLAIQAIASDDTTVTVFTDPLNPFFLNTSLSSVTNNTFTDFSAREIKGAAVYADPVCSHTEAVADDSHRDGLPVRRGARTRGGSDAGLRPRCGADQPQVPQAVVHQTNPVTTARPLIEAHAVGSGKSR